MKRLVATLVASLILVGMMFAGCSQAAAPAPTAAPTASKAAEPTTAPAAAPSQAPAQPTTAPVAKVNFPEKGKTISIIIPWPTGGGNDITARILAAGMEKDLGTPVQVVNKPGAGSQVGIAEGALAKPDGYTLVNTALPNTIGIYMDPDRKATFDRKSFIPVALHTLDPITVAVNASSPFKSIKDVIDYAKANPRKLTAGTGGVAGVQHLAILDFQKLAGVKFAIVHFNGGAEQVTNLLGGHIDLVFDFPPSVLPQTKSGLVRPLAVLDKQPFKALADVPTMESQGYKMYMSTSRIFSVPAGTPPEIVNALGASIKRVMDTAEHQQKISALGIELRWMDPSQLGQYWADMESTVTPLLPLTKEAQ